MTTAEHLLRARIEAIWVANGILSRAMNIVDRTNLLNGDVVRLLNGHTVWYSDNHVNVWCGPDIDPDREHVVRIEASVKR